VARAKPRTRVSELPLASPSQYRRRKSKRHGLGVFAVKPIRAGTRVIEYTGELISHAEGEWRYPTASDGHEDAEHTYLLQLDDDRVIDANVGGNNARFINHSCAPNCEPMPTNDHMWIVSVRNIRVGEELGYDYGIELDEPHTPERKRRFPCQCGARTCRGSLLKPKRARHSVLVRAAVRRWGEDGR
jgi:SET domain-containing protein